MTRRPSPVALTLALSASILAACQSSASLMAATWTLPLATRPSARRAGALVIRMALDPRSTMALISDVDHLEFDLSEPGIASVQSQILMKSQFGAAPTVTFVGLLEGTAQVTLTAFDSLGSGLGASSASVPITVGQVTSLHMDLVLAPTYIMATPGPTPVPINGSLTLTASVSSGPTITLTPGPSPT